MLFKMTIYRIRNNKSCSCGSGAVESTLAEVSAEDFRGYAAGKMMDDG